MSAVVVRAMFRSHPDKPPHSEIMSRCIDACSTASRPALPVPMPACLNATLEISSRAFGSI